MTESEWPPGAPIPPDPLPPPAELPPAGYPLDPPDPDLPYIAPGADPEQEGE